MHSLRRGAQHLAIHHPAIVTSPKVPSKSTEPDAHLLRPTRMLLDLVATIICGVGFCWLLTTRDEW
ncbi:membrane protein [Gordonia phage ZiggyZoo]|nr:membrane protein [Gordonia phage ZiggyZoo]